MSIKHMVIPDVQQKPESGTTHLAWAGMYALEKRPDVIICIGDWWDMPSLSVYDVGKKGFEGRKYKDDVKAGKDAMKAFLAPIEAYNNKQKKRKKAQYKPRMIFTMGNHEYRIERAVECDRKLEDLMSYKDLCLEELGWEVVDYLQPIIVDGVAYCHFFTSGVMGRPVSSARLMLNKKHQSCVMGHVQDRDIAFSKRADGTPMTGIFCGIFYDHDEAYLNAQTNGSWSGVWMLHDVKDGAFDEMPVSMTYLEKRYASCI